MPPDSPICPSPGVCSEIWPQDLISKHHEYNEAIFWRQSFKFLESDSGRLTVSAPLYTTDSLVHNLYQMISQFDSRCDQINRISRVCLALGRVLIKADWRRSSPHTIASSVCVVLYSACAPQSWWTASSSSGGYLRYLPSQLRPLRHPRLKEKHHKCPPLSSTLTHQC